MLVHKTVKAKLHSLTKIKEDLISREYNAFQEAVKGKKEDVNLYSATKQQAKKKKIKFQKKPKKKEQPLRLRNDCFRIEKQEDTKISKFWIKIPVYNPEKDRGDSVWCPIVIPRKDEKLIEQCDFGDSELVKKGNDWFVHLVVKKEAEIQDTYNDVLAIDLGVKWIATSVALSDRKTNFYGKEIRKIRGHYFYLRKKLARKKIHQFYNRIKNSKEKDKINDKLHKISKKIIDDAKKRNALIVLGDLKGIRKQNKGRRFNRKLNSFSYHKLVQYIKYKANWEGIQVIKVSEAYTSQFCWRCGTKGVRHNGLFKCSSCGLLENSDRNGAINIGKRALGQVSFKSRGTTGSAQNPSSEQKDFKQGYSKRLGNLPPLEGRGCQGVILNY